MKCSLDFKREIKEEVIDYLELNASHRDTTYAINPKLVTKSEIKYINDYFKDEVVKKINDTTITIEPSLELLVEKQEIYQKAIAMINKAPEKKGYKSYFQEETERLSNKTKYFDNKTVLDSKEALEKIAKSKSPLSGVAYKLLNYDIINPVKIELVSDESLNFKGVYYGKTNKIKININDETTSADMAEIIVHEILHAYSFNEILRGKNTKLKTEFYNLYNHAVKNSPYHQNYKTEESQGAMKIAYALSNPDEFFVALFTSSAFMKHLSTIKPLNPERKNLLDDFIHWVLSVFNIKKDNPTLYQEAYSVAVELLEENKEYKYYKATKSIDYDFENSDKFFKKFGYSNFSYAEHDKKNLETFLKYNFDSNDYLQYSQQNIVSKKEARDLKLKGVHTKETDAENYIVYTEDTRLEFKKSYTDNQGINHYLFAREHDKNKNVISTAQDLSKIIDEDCQ